MRRESAQPQQEKEPPDRLKELCGDDPELYEAMSYALMLRPRDKEPLEYYLKRASEAEQQADRANAYANYLIAGQVSLFQGRVEDVKACFTKCMRLSRDGGEIFRPLVERTEKALEIAKEYYRTQEAPPP
jgi:hypothetical protein